MGSARTLRMVFFAVPLIVTLGGTRLPAISHSDNATIADGTVWSIAAAGDSIMTREVRCFENEPEFMALMKSIRDADAAVINLEFNALRLWEFKGFPQAENGGNYEAAPPEVIQDMK